METEILVVPEEGLSEVIKVIRTGIHHRETAPNAKRLLIKWCQEEEAYLAEGET